MGLYHGAHTFFAKIPNIQAVSDFSTECGTGPFLIYPALHCRQHFVRICAVWAALQAYWSPGAGICLVIQPSVRTWQIASETYEALSDCGLAVDASLANISARFLRLDPGATTLQERDERLKDTDVMQSMPCEVAIL